MLVMFLMGSLSFFGNVNHLLGSLLSLEMMSLSVMFYWIWWGMSIGGEIYGVMIFLVVGVCVSVIGLCMVVEVSRCYDSSYCSVVHVVGC
uniref:NADH-ubiquinone oxidoreductase chain 4L n=1 Tax=Armillifer agkistrodontis TaxID=592791 RepID=A0A1J0CYJ0_ARMAG|nr:NADH dehydrogenase subunit 4L [Armillifer agkistrodontis]APB92074.1 NADH dehydrogenase subunit 4L [Armillifer agkistrodontis]